MSTIGPNIEMQKQTVSWLHRDGLSFFVKTRLINNLLSAIICWDNTRAMNGGTVVL